MAHVFSYQRVSSSQQVAGHGLQRQETSAQDWLAAHPQHQLVATYDDQGVSAYSGSNLLQGTGLHQFLTLLRSGGVPAGSILLCENFDRLSRQGILYAIPLIIEIVQADVTIITLMDGRETNKANLDVGSFLVTSIGIDQAHTESAKKSQRIGKVWQEKIRDAMADGTPHGKNCPRWIRLSDDGKRYELIPDKADLVTRMFELRLAGHGLLEVANMLNDEGIPTLTPKRKNSSGRFRMNRPQFPRHLTALK